MDDPLIYVVAVLAIIEIGLAIVFSKVGQKMYLAYLEISKLNRNIEDTKKEAAAIKDNLEKLYNKFKSLESGKLHIAGESAMLGKVEFDLELGRNEEK